MRTQLKDLSELVGRTIEGAHEASNWQAGAVVLCLSGDAFAYLVAQRDFSDGAEVLLNKTFHLEEWPTSAVEWGVCSEGEALAATEVQKRRLADQQEARERAQYEQLRVKFEEKP